MVSNAVWRQILFSEERCRRKNRRKNLVGSCDRGIEDALGYRSNDKDREAVAGWRGGDGRGATLKMLE